MNFLHPAFLWALFALIIPIIIHLFNFQKSKKVYFSNTHFLQHIEQQTKNLRQLKNLILLALRLLFVAAIVFAFANPYFDDPKNQKATDQSGPVVLVLDNSFSMQTGDQASNNFESALAQIESLVSGFGISGRFILITNDFETNSNQDFSATQIKEKLALVKLSLNYKTARTIVDRIQTLPQQASQIFWFSDFQRSTLGSLVPVFKDSAHQYTLVPALVANPANLYIDSAWLQSPFVRAKENNVLYARLRHSGPSDQASGTAATLYIGDSQAGTANAKPKPNQSAILSFTFNLSENKTYQARLSLQDPQLVFDNQYLMNLRASDPIKIVLISQSEPQSPYFPAVFGNTALFALKKYTLSSIVYKDLQNADLIVLDGLSSVPVGLQTTLNGLMRNKGTHLALLPPLGANQASIPALNGLPSLVLAGADSGRNQGQIDAPIASNPFFEGVFELTPGQLALPKTRLQWSWPSGSGQNLLTLKNNTPFLSAFRAGKGRLYVFGAASQDAANQFVQHSFFPPVMYRMAMLSLSNHLPLAFSLSNAQISLPLPERIVAQLPVSLENQTSKIVAAARLGPQNLLLSLPVSQMSAGFYDLYQDKKILTSLAFNLPSQESQMRFWQPDQLRELSKPYSHIRVKESGSVSDMASVGKAGNDAAYLWKIFVWLALGCLLGEALVVRFWKS